jgi:hypothetical protein
MTAKTIVITAFFTLSLSGAAFARDQVVSAHLTAPTTQTQLVASAALWTCAEQTCVARTSQSATVRTCRQFVREIGAPVSAFGPESAQLTEDQLAQCNEGFVAQTQQAQN